MMKKQIHSIIICLLLTITFFTIIYSKPIMESVSFSILIWKDNLFPSLFPFFVLSNCLLQYGFVDIIGKLFKPIMPVVFHLPAR
ncbi:MAG: sporulation integral membrane protein YlbJ, partial [bacterium]|nr:sporulation integral membrane protein YlbJ [bacterium]